MADKDAIEIGGVRLTSPDKVLFPEQGVTKRELAAYYLAVADVMLPHVRNRPITLVVPYTPGTGADILSRLLGPKMAERWKVPVVTDNRVTQAGHKAFVASEITKLKTAIDAAGEFAD